MPPEPGTGKLPLKNLGGGATQYAAAQPIKPEPIIRSLVTGTEKPFTKMLY